VGYFVSTIPLSTSKLVMKKFVPLSLLIVFVMEIGFV